MLFMLLQIQSNKIIFHLSAYRSSGYIHACVHVCYICTFVIYVFVCIYACIGTYIYIHTYLFTDLYMYVGMYMCVNTHVCACIYI